MNSRLQQFLTLEQITPARLADTLGIQRSSISHILSGRNKPSYDFLKKFILKFPNISPDWLMTGKGKPYRNLDSQDENEISLFTNHEVKNISSPIIEPENIFQTTDNNNVDLNLSKEHLPESSINTHNTGDMSVKRTVKRVTIFYSDGSFEELYS